MALTPCEPCECIPANIPNDKFKQDVLVILCAILEARSEILATLVENVDLLKEAKLEVPK